MTLKQEAYEKIDSLPNDESIRFVINIIDQFKAAINRTAVDVGEEDVLSAKRQAFLHMEEMKKKRPFPPDYDYEKARDEAVAEKYGCVD